MDREGHRLESRGWRAWSRWFGIALLAFVAVHSVAYGGGFIADPVNGAGEFGESVPSTPAAENLAGLVGVILLLLAATVAVTATLLIRRVRAAAWLTSGLGVALIAVGAYWFTRGVAWDAGFYGLVGSLLLVSAVLTLWPSRAS